LAQDQEDFPIAAVTDSEKRVHTSESTPNQDNSEPKSVINPALSENDKKRFSAIIQRYKACFVSNVEDVRLIKNVPKVKLHLKENSN